MKKGGGREGGGRREGRRKGGRRRKEGVRELEGRKVGGGWRANTGVVFRELSFSRGDFPGSEKHASLENTLVRFKPDTKKFHNIFFQFMTVHVL